MALVIKKTVDLSGLGNEYKGIEFVFRSIPVKDLADLSKQQEKLGEKLDEIIPYFIEVLENQFVSGKQEDTDLTKEDVKELDAEAVIYCFQVLTGQATDPKVSSESKTTSSTEAEAPQKS